MIWLESKDTIDNSRTISLHEFAIGLKFLFVLIQENMLFVLWAYQGVNKACKQVICGEVLHTKEPKTKKY